MGYIKVEGHQGLVRDTNSGAIINTSTGNMTRARQIKFARQNKQKEFNEMKNQISELKNLVMKLIEEKDGSNSN